MNFKITQNYENMLSNSYRHDKVNNLYCLQLFYLLGLNVTNKLCKQNVIICNNNNKFIVFLINLFITKIYQKYTKFLLLKNTKIFYFNNRSLQLKYALKLVSIIEKKIIKSNKKNNYKTIKTILSFYKIKSETLFKSFICRFNDYSYYLTNLMHYNLIHKKFYNINGIITIKLSYSDIYIYISDIRNNIKLTFKGSYVTKSKKLTKHTIIAVLNQFITHSQKFNIKTVALHIRGLKKNRKFIKNKLKKHFYIQILKFLTNFSYNGCRLKKIKKKKNFTKRLKFFNFFSYKRKKLYKTEKI